MNGISRNRGQFKKIRNPIKTAETKEKARSKRPIQIKRKCKMAEAQSAIYQFQSTSIKLKNGKI